MKVCDCYRQLEPIQLMVGECLGAKNKPRVDCLGDESHCLFYSDRRRKAKSATNADRIRAMTDEELAMLLGAPTIVSPPWCDMNYDCPYIDQDPARCDLCALDWLKQEAKE